MFRPFVSKLPATLALVAVMTVLTGCESSRWGFPYRNSVQQGNWVTKDQVGMLREGMTREQVKFALGTPTLTSVLHSNRWDYPYYFRSGHGKVEERVLTVFFDNNRLARWKGDEQPELQPFQIAKDEVGISQREDAQLKLDATRAGNDAGLPGEIMMAPGLTLGETLQDVSVSDPAAIPGAPDDAPMPLE